MIEVDHAEVQHNQNVIADQNERNRLAQTWTLFIDGSLKQDGSGVGIVLKSLEVIILEKAVRLDFPVSNNESEYEALIVGLKKAKLLSIEDLLIHCDSQLVANQLIKEYVARNQSIEAYMRLAHKLFRNFKSALLMLKDSLAKAIAMQMP